MRSLEPTTNPSRDPRAVTRPALPGLLWALGLLLAGALVATAQPAAREYDVKATLLYNFCYFVEWPPAAVDNTNAPFVIGILGNDPFGGFLDELVKNERVGQKRIEIRRFRTVEQALGAQILFISPSEERRFGSILSVLRDKPVLTVTDATNGDFLRRGGMVELVMRSGTVRVRVNPSAARASNLAISAKLLHLAEVVHFETH